MLKEKTVKYMREVTTRFKKIEGPIVYLSAPDAVHSFMHKRTAGLTKEHFYSLSIDHKNRLLLMDPVSIGTITESIVHPREVFHNAVKALAAGIIVVHNHPSGSKLPSKQDEATTQRLMEAGKIMGIPVVDHIIVTDDGYYSFKENGNIL